MKTTLQLKLANFAVFTALLFTSYTSSAVPITYDISSGSAPGFSATWLHAGTNEMGSTGYFANGIKAGMTGTLTLDMTALTASGSITGSGNFGLGSDTWTLGFTGANANSVTFVDSNMDLLSLNYSLSSVGGHSSTGIFYFANRDFNGGTVSDGPNYIDNSVLYLWGNNWLNDNGASDRADFINAGGTPLGLDLYGEARPAPEPSILALIAVGLIGFSVVQRKRKANSKKMRI